MPPTLDEMFPPSERELYKHASVVLTRVACEVRFPRVLRLEAHAPAEFQEAINNRFPLYEKAMTVQVPEGVQVPPEFMQMLASQPGNIAHHFMTEDRKSTVAISPENLAFSTSVYARWEEFRAAMMQCIDALVEIYSVPFFLRVGLRYIDVIKREEIGLTDRPWAALINPDLLGKFPFADFETNVTKAAHQIVLTMPDDAGLFALRHGFPSSTDKKNPSYALDFDFSRQPKTEITDAPRRLDQFNQLAGRAFRWCLTKELRDALGPESLPTLHAGERIAAGTGR